RRLGAGKLGKNVVELSLPLIPLSDQVIQALLRLLSAIQRKVILSLELLEIILPTLEHLGVDVVRNVRTVINTSHEPCPSFIRGPVSEVLGFVWRPPSARPALLLVRFARLGVAH